MRPDILTRSGTYFDFVHPTQASIRIEDIAYALSRTCRFGGFADPYYSVAQHCVLASHIVPVQDALRGLLHDAAEAYVGDVPKPLKNLLPDYQVIEKRVELAVLTKFGLTYPMPPSVKVADIILLATEQRDFMPKHDDDWAAIAGITPLTEHITPWSMLRAQAEFLKRFYSLYGA